MKLFWKKSKEEKTNEIKAFISGNTIPISEVNDPVFSSKTLGDGLGIKPEGEIIYAPCSGKISTIAKESGHAIGMTLNNGAEIMIHVGLDTVSMNGKGFKVFVKEGEKVKEGQKLLKFDKTLIESEGLDTTCVFVVINSDQFPDVKYFTGQNAREKQTVICSFE